MWYMGLWVKCEHVMNYLGGNVICECLVVLMEWLGCYKFGCCPGRPGQKELVNRLDYYNTSRKIGTCEPCIGGKQAKLPFQTSSTSMSVPLELVHSDLCWKMGDKSIGGAEYFITFLDHHTHYCWVYPLERRIRHSDASETGRQKWKIWVINDWRYLGQTTEENIPRLSSRIISRIVGSGMKSLYPRLQNRMGQLRGLIELL